MIDLLFTGAFTFMCIAVGCAFLAMARNMWRNS